METMVLILGPDGVCGVAGRVQTESLAAARRAVEQARREPGIDPEAADRVLERLDRRAVMLD